MGKRINIVNVRTADDISKYWKKHSDKEISHAKEYAIKCARQALAEVNDRMLYTEKTMTDTALLDVSVGGLKYWTKIACAATTELSNRTFRRKQVADAEAQREAR